MKQRKMKRVKEYAIIAISGIYGVIIVAWWILIILGAMPILVIWYALGWIDIGATISRTIQSAWRKAKLTWRRE